MGTTANFSWTTPEDAEPLRDGAATVRNLANDIDADLRKSNPIGSVIMHAGGTTPAGWLVCDGSAVSRDTYSDLYAVIGDTYGAGDGTTTFNLPNLAGRVPVGLDAVDVDFDALGDIGGAKTHTLTTTEIPSHGHSGSSGAHSHGHTASSGSTSHGHSASSGSHSHGHTASTGTAGGHTHSYTEPSGYKTDLQGGGTLGRWAGSATSNTSSNGSHSHTVSVGSSSHSHTVSVGSSSHSHTVSVDADSHSHTVSIGATGGGGAHNNVQPYITLNFIIKT